MWIITLLLPLEFLYVLLNHIFKDQAKDWHRHQHWLRCILVKYNCRTWSKWWHHFVSGEALAPPSPYHCHLDLSILESGHSLSKSRAGMAREAGGSAGTKQSGCQLKLKPGGSNLRGRRRGPGWGLEFRQQNLPRRWTKREIFVGQLS